MVGFAALYPLYELTAGLKLARDLCQHFEQRDAVGRPSNSLNRASNALLHCMSRVVALRVFEFSHSLGPSRHFAAMQRFSRTWSEADINWQAKPADSVENENSRRRRHDGLVSKRRDRPYQAVRSKHWVKVKNRKHPAMESRDGVFRLTRRRSLTAY
jgi:hypothetical protein